MVGNGRDLRCVGGRGASSGNVDGIDNFSKQLSTEVVLGIGVMQC